MGCNYPPAISFTHKDSVVISSSINIARIWTSPSPPAETATIRQALSSTVVCPYNITQDSNINNMLWKQKFCTSLVIHLGLKTDGEEWHYTLPNLAEN